MRAENEYVNLQNFDHHTLEEIEQNDNEKDRREIFEANEIYINLLERTNESLNGIIKKCQKSIKN